MSNPIPKYQFKAQSIIDAGRTTRTNIDVIRKWLSENPGIPKLSDEQVVLFLLSCSNNINLTMKTILSYYKDKYNSPELFSNRDPTDETLISNFDVVHMTPFPKYTEDNCMVIFSGIRDTSYRKFHLDQSTKLFFMCLELGLNKNPPAGLKIILDFKGFGLMHLTRLKLGTVQTILHFLQECLPCQLKEIHIVNTNYLFEKVLFLCKPFMKKELMDMIHPHLASTPFSEFHKFIGPEYLPCDFDGELPSIAELTQQTIRNLKGLKSFFEDDERQLTYYKST